MPRLALVVDDSMLIRHTVCRFLEERGFNVESASHGLDALNILDRFRPDLIVTDLQMPRMDGGELIRTVRTRPQLATVPIIVLTAQKESAPESLQVAYLIYKDISIVEQLDAALTAIHL
jgi:CheY-like chemotaxis protein